MNLTGIDPRLARIIAAVAGRFYRKLGHSQYFELDWFVNSAWAGVMDALPRCKVGEPGWKAFLGMRAQGRIQDDLRDWDPVSRVMRAQGRIPTMRRIGMAANGEDGDRRDGLSIEAPEPPAKHDPEVWDQIEKLLQPRHGQIMRLYFVDGMTLKKIGEKFGRTEGRIQQLVKEAKASLKAQLLSGRLPDLMEVA